MTRPSVPVTRLLAEVERFGAAPFRTTGPGLAIDLPQVQRCIDLIQLRFSEMAAAFAATDEYDVQGSVSPIHWIRLNCHMGGGAASDRVAVGEQLGHMP